jgi:lipopolysaccharide export system permease protein
MIRILDKLVARTFIKLFGIFLIACPPLFILGDINENLAKYMDRGLTRWEVATAYLYQIPLFIEWSFPIAALVGAVFTVYSMTTNRELVAAKAGGISFHRVVSPILALGVVLTGAALGITALVPHTNRIAGQILKNENPARAYLSDFVYAADDGTTWQVGSLTPSARRMTDVSVEWPLSDSEPMRYIKAESAWPDSTGWVFHAGYVRYLYPDSMVRTFQFERIRVPGLRERPEQMLESGGTPRQPDEMTYSEIGQLAALVQRSGGNSAKLWVQRDQKLSIPVAVLVVILFGVPLATSSRRGGTAYGVGVSLGTTILYLLLFKVAAAMGSAGTISPQMAAWAPDGLFAAAAAGLLVRVRT